jgi:hypothetical protein
MSWLSITPTTAKQMLIKRGCPKGAVCSAENLDRCTIIDIVRADLTGRSVVLFVQPCRRHCPYQISYADSLICRCPERTRQLGVPPRNAGDRHPLQGEGGPESS